MSMTQTIKKFFSVVLVLIMLIGMVPTTVFAASDNVVDTAVIFSDLHTKKSDYKESTLKNVMSVLKNSGMHISSVTSAGDAFSVNEDSSSSNGPYTGYTSKLTNAIQSVLGNVPVNYVWSDHDRYAVQEDGTTLLDKTSRLVYGAGNDGVYGTDDDGNYYVYSLSMGDLGSYDRYKAGFNTDNGNSRASKGFTATVQQAVANFQADAAKLKKDRPLFIASHQPLFDNRNDNAFAELWFDAINEVAAGMDVAFFYGHNHKYDTGNDYYYAKGSTMPVTTTNGWNGYQTGSGYQYTKGDPKPVNKTLNFTHMCAGYLAPSSTGSTSTTTREGTLVAITIYDDAINYTTYNSNGVYTGKYALNVTVPRTFANIGGTVEPEEPEPVPTEPEVTVPAPTEPSPSEPVVPDAGGEWIELPAGNTYVLDTDGIDSGAKYLIVAKSYAKALTAASSRSNASDVTVSGSNATADPSYGWTFTVSGSGYQIHKNGTYLGRSSSSLASGSSGTVWTVSSQGSGNYNVTQTSSRTYYVRWSNSNGYFQASTSSKDPVRLYKYTGSGVDANYIRLAGETEQNYVIADTADLNTVLDKVRIQTSDDGSTVSGEISVTSGMVSWDKTFNGNTAGTYTGTVTYANEVLGTITVTVIAKHNFETITVNATCTEDGTVTTKCTICGEQTVEIIKAMGHDYKCVETAATCGKDGAKVYTCANCADTYTEVIKATGAHTFETVAVAATCTQEGSVTTTCIVCGEQTVEKIAAFGHNYTSVTVDATCTETGFVTYTCETCGDSYVETIAALGHSYESNVTSATCTENGYTTYTCVTCGHSYMGEEIAAFGHDYASKVIATCTEAGFVVYTCNTCGHSYNGEAVAAYGHSYETTTVEPTCSTAGYTTYICTSCGYTYTGNEVAALGHSYEAVVTAATCTEAGYTTYTCTACGHSYVGGNVAALGHDYDSVVTTPTYEAEGYTTHTCKVCGHVKVDSFVPMLSHTYETVTTEATCTEDGSVVHTCVECGYSYTEVLPALGHVTETVTTEATCTADGSVVTTCTVCGETDVEVIPATGHSYETVTIAPTCTEAGYTTHTCTCGHVVTEETAALGHAYSSKTVAPTCTENGGIIYTCETCGYSYTDVMDALGHSYAGKTVAPTCTNAGYIVYTCETCGHSYNSDEVAALGHSYESTVTEPTCTAGGYTTHSCTVCGYSYTDGNTAATGHSYTTREENGKRIYTCGNCGYSYSESLAMTYTKVSSISGDNNYVITFVSGSKYYAMSHKDNKISAVQVKVSSNKITTEITEDLVWTYDNNKLSYQSGSTTYYLYAKSSNSWWGGTPTLSISSTNSTNVSFSNSKLKLSNYYLRYSSGKISLSSRSSTTNIFLEQ